MKSKLIGVFDIFSKRQKRLRGECPDVYQYEILPEKLKVQIVHIWGESLGKDRPARDYMSPTENRDYYEQVYGILCKEFGVFELPNANVDNYERSLFVSISNYFLQESDIEKCLDVVELMAIATEEYLNFEHQWHRHSTIELDDIIGELNYRFKEHGVGYQFENGQIIRVDSQYVHSEVVKPVLSLLSDPVYAGAQQEFLTAHEHYRHQRYQPAMVECLKAYESTIKIIMTKRGWQYSPDDTANALTGKIMQQGLIPDYLLQYFKSLKNTLVSSLASVRNNEAGHGQGVDLKNVPEYLVSYMLHMTASAILFLIQAEKALP